MRHKTFAPLLALGMAVSTGIVAAPAVSFAAGSYTIPATPSINVGPNSGSGGPGTTGPNGDGIYNSPSVGINGSYGGLSSTIGATGAANGGVGGTSGGLTGTTGGMASAQGGLAGASGGQALLGGSSR